MKKIFARNLTFLSLILLSSCIQENTELFEIDTDNLADREIVLSEIANDIIYIPLEKKFPIGIIYSYEFINNYIYLSIKDVGVIRFTKSGQYDKKYGKIGRGPREYVYCLRFSVDRNNESVYVMDHKMDVIKVYNSNGLYIRTIQLPIDKYGCGMNDLKYFNSSLIICQYINMGRGEYNWIITDTLGNVKKVKKNPYHAFNGRFGSNGGIYSFKDYIGYWDSCKDTIYKISANFNYYAIGRFKTGEQGIPRNSADYDLGVFNKNKNKYIRSRLLFETNDFFIYKYSLNNALRLLLIDKSNGKVKSIVLRKNRRGIINNIDSGIAFNPDIYFANQKDEEYLVSIIHPFEIISRVASETFKISVPKYPEKKTELEKLAESLDENDNPILMLVKLKE